MGGSFKTILDSTNNIITRNPRVQERFDLPYLLHRDPADWRGDEGSLALCKLMPLDNDTYDVNMPSLEGKAWAGANGDWVVYIGYNCEWELVNVYTRQRIPLPKSHSALRLSTQMIYVRSNTIKVAVIYGR